MDYKKGLVDKLVEKIKEIFAEEKLGLLIGYAKGTLPLRATPCLIESADDVDRLMFDFTCQNNLARYLVDEKKRGDDRRRVGIIAKGCDARAVVQLVVEGQFERENVVIIGVPCKGVIDPGKLRKKLAGREIKNFEIDGDKITLFGNGFELELDMSELFLDSCLSCRYPNAAQYDYFIGEPAEPLGVRDEYASVDEFEKRSPDERWAYFEKEYSRCIRCYACRNACPMCYCEECFVDRSTPQWTGKGNDLSDTVVFHIVRALHTAGRCVDCGACVAACPLNIDVRMLGKRIEKEVRERFGFTAGLDFEAQPAMATFNENDKEEFIM